MINNHILAMSGAVYWLGAIFFWKIMEFFVTFEWFRHVDPWNQVLLQNPINQSHYTPESVQNQCLLEKYNSWIFFSDSFLWCLYKGSWYFFFRFFEYSFCWNRSITLNTVICRNRGFFVLNAYIQKIMQLIS